MDDKNVIASAISDNELARAFSELVADRWDNWDLSEFLPYLVDTVAPSVLPYLADQFDIDGLQGFGMAETEQQQRDIIKKSIALHKFIGTPWAIREACRTVGFPIVILEEESPPSLAAPRVPRTGRGSVYSLRRPIVATSPPRRAVKSGCSSSSTKMNGRTWSK